MRVLQYSHRHSFSLLLFLLGHIVRKFSPPHQSNILNILPENLALHTKVILRIIETCLN